MEKTIIDKYYDHIIGDEKQRNEYGVVFDIISEMSDRGGIGDEWSMIDEDIKEEIIESWTEIVKKYKENGHI